MLAYYISSHGYGHGVRSSDVINALRRQEPDLPLVLVSGLPRAFLENRLERPEGVAIREAAFDVGMVQRDSIRVDIPATLDAVSRLYSKRVDLIAGETAFLRTQGVRTVVVDIPALPAEAAHACGIPCVAIGNFAWDWIYGPFSETDKRWEPIIEYLQEGYRKTDLLLRMPFSEPMTVFPRMEDVPIVARPGKERRKAISELTGASLDKQWVLLSFTSLEWSDEALSNVTALQDYEFFTVKPLSWEGENLYAIDREKVPFADVLASCDVVVSKPGFGLLSECIVNEKPLVYAEREDFIEYPILVEGVERYLKNQHIPTEQLYRGLLAPFLSAIPHRPAPEERMAAGGDDIVARRILDYYHSTS